MYGGLLYYAAYAWLDFLFVTDDSYRSFSFWLLCFLGAAAFVTRKKWMARLKERYALLGIQVTDKRFSSAVSDIVWLFLELYFITFLFLIPGFLSVSILPEYGVFYVIVTIIVFTLVLCDTQFDVILTGERALPPIWLRMMPVSVVASAVMALLFVWPGVRLDEVRAALYLQLLFLGELFLNLGIRYALRKKKEEQGVPVHVKPSRELTFISWLLIGIVFVEVCPFLLYIAPAAADKAAGPETNFVLGAVFTVQTLCLFLFFRKRRVWASWIRSCVAGKYKEGSSERSEIQDIIDKFIMMFLLLCLLLFGFVLPGFFMPGKMQFQTTFFFTAFLLFFLMINCLSAPLYGILTGSGEAAGGWRFPYLTLAACTYAVCKVPMPWTDTGLLVALTALGLLELFSILGIHCFLNKRKSCTLH